MLPINLVLDSHFQALTFERDAASQLQKFFNALRFHGAAKVA